MDDEKIPYIDQILHLCKHLGWDLAVPHQEYGGGGLIVGMPEYVDQCLNGLPEGVEHVRYKPCEETLQ